MAHSKCGSFVLKDLQALSCDFHLNHGLNSSYFVTIVRLFVGKTRFISRTTMKGRLGREKRPRSSNSFWWKHSQLTATPLV
jgi:hypothetical protein